MVLKKKRKATISLISCCILSGCNGWIPVSPYGNMPTRETFEFQSKLKANPDLKRSFDYSYGTYELVGPNAQTWRFKPPQWGKYKKDNSRLINNYPPKVSVPDL